MTVKAVAANAQVVEGLWLSWGALSHRGVRRGHNEDSFLADPPVFVVADGMGGHARGELASVAAVDALANLPRATVSREDLLEHVELAQRHVDALADGEGAAPGTTITGAALSTGPNGLEWLIFNVGDSRTYRFSDGQLQQVTVDHSRAQELRDAGELNPGAERIVGVHNVITRALGAGSSRCDPDFFSVPIRPGDRLLICSDGLSTDLDDSAISDVLGELVDPQQAAELLVERTCQAGARDNVTVIVVDVHSGSVEPLVSESDHMLMDFDDTLPNVRVETATVQSGVEE